MGWVVGMLPRRRRRVGFHHESCPNCRGWRGVLAHHRRSRCTGSNAILARPQPAWFRPSSGGVAMSIGVLIVDEFPVSLHYWRRIEILPPWNDGLEFLWISNKGDYARFHHLLKQGGEQIPVDIVLLNVEFGTCRSKIAPDPRDRCSVFDLLQNQRRFDSDSVLFGIDADRIGKELRLVWGDSAVIVPFSRQIDVETADVWPVADADCPVLSIPPGSARDEFSILMRYGLETMRDRILSSPSWDVGARVVLKAARRTF